MPVRYNYFQRFTTRLITATVAVFCGLLVAVLLETFVAWVAVTYVIGRDAATWRPLLQAAFLALLAACAWVGALTTARIGTSFVVCVLFGTLLAALHFVVLTDEGDRNRVLTLFSGVQLLVGALGYLPRWLRLRRIAREKKDGEESLLSSLV